MTSQTRNRRIKRRRAARQGRRGILLLVVLSMLVLFVLVGAAYLVTSSNYRTGSRVSEKSHRNAPQPTDLLSRALRQVVRDTRNPHSVARYHSLLRDVYGTDGFVALAYELAAYAPDPTSAPRTPNALTAQYAGASRSRGLPAGPTQGQLIDIFVRDQVYPPGAVLPNNPTAADVLKLELSEENLPENLDLPRTDGYYNGCLLTMLDGPARGQTARIIEYDYLNDNDSELTRDTALASALNNLAPAPVFRIRVVAFPRADGTRLALGLGGSPNELVGRTFMVNGRPFNGAGVGLNLMASTGGAQLSAYEAVRGQGGAVGGPGDDFLGGPVALFPNPKFYRRVFQPTAGPPSYNLFRLSNNAPPSFLTADGGDITDGSTPLYNAFDGPGGADESYDVADYQNMYLASMPLNPRARGRVVPSGGGPSQEVAQYYQGQGAPAPLRLDLEGLPIPSFHRPALVNFWLHRLFNAPWLASDVGDPNARVRAILQPFGPDGQFNTGDEPSSPAVAAQIVAFKRKYTLRPLREDHPDFDGSNPQAQLPANFSGYEVVRTGPPVPQITFPSPEVAGPWDVDNDNDGVPDSIWVDLGMPVQETEDGRLYKPLFAIMVQDLDGRLNLNAHGSPASLVDAQRRNAGRHDFSTQSPGALPRLLANVADGVNRQASVQTVRSSDQLPHGRGFGPADVSLRPVLSPEWPIADPTKVGDPAYDDYARVLTGRPAPQPGQAAPPVSALTAFGRYGSVEVQRESGVPVAPGVPLRLDASAVALNTLDPLPTLEKFGHPHFSPSAGAVLIAGNVNGALALGAGQPSGFGTMPDKHARFSVGLDYAGQPVYEAEYRPYNIAGMNPIVTFDEAIAPLLADSPYETDLMSAARRDSVVDATQMVSAYQTTNPINDDAPYSPAELERVLRAYDADAGRLPDRLWSVVDALDPDKLAVQLHQVNTGAADTSGYAPSSGELLQAQIEAAARRRSVTTETFDIPSTNENWTARLMYGADGQPGVAGADDDGNGEIDDLAELNAPNSDDYFNVMGERPPESARLLDYLRYRIVLELKRQYPGAYPGAMAASNPALERAVNRVIHGDNGAVATGPPTPTNIPPIYAEPASFGGLLAPEVIAGRKMDLNRPFGDGKDNNGNGVVDEPTEAGEPYVDQNSNGIWDSGEPFLDANSNGQYDPGNGPSYQPLLGDNVWSGQGDITNPADYVPLDHTNGQDATGRGAFVGGVNGPRVRDDGQMARQLYARHLYCLALLLMDENYLTPIDKNDPQVAHYLDPSADPNPQFGRPRGSVAWEIAQFLAGDGDLNGTPAASAAQQAQAVQIARRKLTCRKIAQWAINCADMRDPDAIMTPFEYDENPWNGWGVSAPGRSGTVFFPLDGDLTTDENVGAVRDVTNGFQLAGGDVAIAPAAQTRGVVWGAERPELLITETFATHERKVEDLNVPFTGADGNETDSVGNPSPTSYVPTTEQPPDDENVRVNTTMAQRLRPHGACYVEVYNPGSPDGQKPAELYGGRDLNGDGGVDTALGVDLSRMSLTAFNGQRSPVWRMVAVEDHPRLRNDDDTDDATEGAYSDRSPKIHETLNGQTAPRMRDIARSRMQPPQTKRRATITDTSFPTFDPQAQPVFAGSESVQRSPNFYPERVDRLQMRAPRHYVERAFYFTRGNNPVRDPNIQMVRIPQNRIVIPRQSIPPFWQTFLQTEEQRLLWPDRMALLDNGDLAIYADRFIATQGKLSDNAAAPEADIPIAPILPGRYGVVGTAGFSFIEGSDGPKRYDGRLITTLGRRAARGVNYGPEFDSVMPVTGEENAGVDGASSKGTRRIELAPHPNPEAHQVLIGDNGGNESRIVDFEPDGLHDRNVTSQFVNTVAQDAANPGARNGLPPGAPERYIQPAVAIPVEGMSISTPLDSYLLRWMELEPGSAQQDTLVRDWDPLGARGEGQYIGTSDQGRPRQPNPFPEPLDLPRELVENHTTPNYRSLHLQRLANPLLPWNPAPGAEGHAANLPVNPYVTVDASSADLTAFSGTDPQEQNLADQGSDRSDRGVQFPAELHEYNAPLPVARRQGRLLTYASHQRGMHAGLTGDSLPPFRGVFAQEPVSTQEDLDTQGQMPTLMTHDPNSGAKMDYVTDYLVDELQPENHVVPYAFRHSLGYMNNSYGYINNAAGVDRQQDQNAVYFGEFYTQTDNQAYNSIDINGDGVPGDLVGSPKTSLGDQDLRNDDTYPWLYWGNRPFASPLELTQVPASSSASLTRDFSMFNQRLMTQRNPYGGGEIDPTATADESNATRTLNQQGHFGHLLNLFSNSVSPAVTLSDPMGEPKPTGAANLHRLVDYLHVPSPFVGTQATLNPVIWNPQAGPTDPTDPFDPRSELLAPFNKVDQYREPGRVNLNTVLGRQVTEPYNGVQAYASPVYDGLMHRVHDQNYRNGGALTQIGHRGPMWRDVAVSRRGYWDENPGLLSSAMLYQEHALHSLMPTFFSNPFRASGEGALVPLDTMVRAGAEATLLRSHPYSPGPNGVWGTPGHDPDPYYAGAVPADGVINDASEAGVGGGSDDVLNFNTGGVPTSLTPRGLPIPYAIPAGRGGTTQHPRVPLFSATETEPSLNGLRNPALRYMPMTRLSSMTTTRSGAFAIWITVGYFEVKPAPPWTDPETNAPNPAVQDRFLGDRQMYDMVYPDGYQLGRELGSDTGDTTRHRGFWIVDRTLPVAFKPGEDVNIEKMILLERRIE